jgi:hypothetical protein
MILGAFAVFLTFSLTLASPEFAIVGRSGLKLSIPGKEDGAIN